MTDHETHIDPESTYQCSHCHCNILSSNQFTHDAICARRNASGNQRIAQPQMIRRESSSSGLPDAIEPNYSNRRPQIREDKALAKNKLITCPNCEKSVREQDFTSHAEKECEGSDKIPCEFCDQSIPIASYTHHIEDTHRREREEEQERHHQRQQESQRTNERPASPDRGMAPRLDQNMQENRSQRSGSLEGRDRSPGHNDSQENSGGFMGFIRNLVHTAAQHRSEPNEMPQNRPQPRDQPQSSTRSLLSRLMGNHDEEEHHGRRAPMTMEDFFLRSIQARNEAQRANAQQNQNPFMRSGQQGEGRSVRTINLGPHGTLVFSSGRSAMQEPEDHWQTVGVPQERPNQRNMHSMEDMGPMGLLLQMLNSRNQGMMMPFNINEEQLHQLEETGLSKEDIDSLSVVKYDAEKNKNLSSDMKSCPICLDDFDDGVEVRFLWCLHRFHKKCIDQWLEKHTNCPICKKDFSEMDQQFESP